MKRKIIEVETIGTTEIEPGLLKEDFFEICFGSSYKLQIANTDGELSVYNGINGYGDNCYDELKGKKVTLFTESPQPDNTPSTGRSAEGASEGVAEALRLLDMASNLVGNPGTNISSSTDLACGSWQEKYKQFLASLPPSSDEG